MRTIAIIQARMGSTRLPGKVLFPLQGQPMLARQIARVSRAQTLDGIVIATTDRPEDDPVAALAAACGCAQFRGSEADVLDRFYQAAVAADAGAIVRLTGDCPLTDPRIIDEVVTRLEGGSGGLDYVSNTLEPRTFPRGLDVEACTFAALTVAWREDRDMHTREHVTPYIYRHPELFRVDAVTHSCDLSRLRWTVDTPEDYALLQAITASTAADAPWTEILSAVEAHPEWHQLNASVQQKTVS
ncbi:MAG: glycosyltransferase family protein [Acidobacteria bacterium]|nr:glycosyltransferase family protein [Acidobacteriota bacterium]MCA1650875.1 glycosyltransferase family protein [Acidobacteriota bacterium]